MSDFPTLWDSTMLAALKSCTHKFNVEFHQHWKAKSPSVHLHAGAAFASGLEAAREAFWVKKDSHDAAVATGLMALINHYGDFECPADSAKSCERMAGALEYYFSRYPLGADGAEPITLANGKRGIEISFAEPLPIGNPVTGEPLIYCGRLDQAVGYAGGIFVEDDKTTSQLGASWSRQWDLRSQFTGYCWGLGKAAGVKPNGVLVRGISILKTKYETLEAITYRADWQIDEWFAVTCDAIEDYIKQWKRGWYRKSLDHACTEYGGCPFRQSCMSRDPNSWLSTYFEQREWNPLTRKETLIGSSQTEQPTSAADSPSSSEPSILVA